MFGRFVAIYILSFELMIALRFIGPGRKMIESKSYCGIQMSVQSLQTKARQYNAPKRAWRRPGEAP
jgi:hypothetical protein